MGEGVDTLGVELVGGVVGEDGVDLVDLQGRAHPRPGRGLRGGGGPGGRRAKGMAIVGTAPTEGISKP